VFDGLKALFVTKTDIYEPSTLSFIRLDENKVARDLGLIEKAEERGSRELPASDSQVVDEVEQSIVRQIAQEQRRWHEFAIQHLTTFNQRMAGLNLQGRFADVKSAARTAIGEFKAEIQVRRGAITSARDDALAARDSFKKFKLDHQLTSPPDYSDSHLKQLGLLILIGLIEAVFNGNFLAAGSEFGLLGGVIIAVAIAAVNIILAALAGRFGFSQVHHRSGIRKILGSVITLAWLALAVAISFGVAHYRDAVQLEDPTPQITALRNLVADPLGIVDIQSWLLVAMGIVFALVAFREGFRWDDPYPGYGSKDRQKRDLFDDYNAAAEDAINSLRKIRDEGTAALKETRDGLHASRREHDAVLTHRGLLLSQYEAQADHLEDAQRNLLSLYRRANERVRTTPAPQHFSRNAEHRRLAAVVPEPPSLSAETLDAALTETGTAIEEAMNALHDEFEASVPMMKIIDDL
jgi:hypothetical protein